ncbi:hypothetical protein [Pararhodospirillum oryzae]|uniref:Uncharacterized protein n=1 Tax=Pararhodospirillum oryzae TaxID=478448 RepID=A0A512H492_9PROT|nr:hypothetical protein [Pararhodospirillum oryzae]GEO80272.1 hypothetical protein ROR02_04030 [Pararhodospirillum oryzae]
MSVPCPAAPWVLVSTRAHLAAAAIACREAGCPLVAATPPGAVAWLGPGWLPALVEAVSPPAQLYPLADCASAAGFALTSLTLGIGVVVPEVPTAGQRRLAAIAAPLGLPVLDTRQSAHDLAGLDDPLAACRALLLPLASA